MQLVGISDKLHKKLKMKKIEIYKTKVGQTQVEVHFEDETVWLNQHQLAELFKGSMESAQKLLGNWVLKILEMKSENNKINTSGQEKEIDQLVYELYELTDEKIKIVEGIWVKTNIY